MEARHPAKIIEEAFLGDVLLSIEKVLKVLE